MHFILPGLEARPLGDREGLGVFATRPFAAGTLLVVWGGALMTTAALRAIPGPPLYAIQVEDDLHLVTLPEHVGIADYVNHGCDPNCVLVGQVSLFSARAILPGEEIRYDYATSDADTFEPMRCTCRSPNCRGWIRDDDWRLPELQRRYDGHFSPYIARRLKR